MERWYTTLHPVDIEIFSVGINWGYYCFLVAKVNRLSEAIFCLTL